ncbi:hypothetical protein Hamer_G010325 [Homarus americanus]|uniref:Uncharacterized protein n=1 Tax=Homarus americanus TaxID=6706 RepID=A0A8J5K3E7_HOMAM|nr:hypothetical protein Hamer_G010325 [Homarus americanus]
MFGGSGALGAYGAAAAAGLSGWGGLPHGYPPTSTAAGLVSLAAAQQAQQAAALASLGPAAAAYQDRAMGGENCKHTDIEVYLLYSPVLPYTEYY